MEFLAARNKILSTISKLGWHGWLELQEGICMPKHRFVIRLHLGRFFLLIKVDLLVKQWAFTEKMDLFNKEWTFLLKKWTFLTSGGFFRTYRTLLGYRPETVEMYWKLLVGIISKHTIEICNIHWSPHGKFWQKQIQSNNNLTYNFMHCYYCLTVFCP